MQHAVEQQSLAIAVPESAEEAALLRLIEVERGECLRIISARRATRAERTLYDEA